MSKRDEYMSTMEQSKQKTLGAIQQKTNAVDQMINDIENETANQADTPVVLSNHFALNLKAKEVKTVHKNFLIPKSLNDKLSALSKQTGVSENEIVNEILKKAFMG